MSKASVAGLLLVHGAGSDPSIFSAWLSDFPDVQVAAVDLHAGLNVAAASMADYAEAVETAAVLLPRPLVLCGWSMGGLVVLLAAREVHPEGVVVIEPSPPAEVQGFADPPLHEGVFDPEAVYGTFPPDVKARPEAELARSERKRGISVLRLECPSLVINGHEFADERGTRVAETYRAERVAFPDLNHWGLMSSPDVRTAVRAFLETLGVGEDADRRTPIDSQRRGVPSLLDSASGVADPIQFTNQEVIAILERAGLSTVADDAKRSLPDPVDFEHVAEFAAEHGITRDWLISRMGGSP